MSMLHIATYEGRVGGRGVDRKLNQRRCGGRSPIPFDLVGWPVRRFPTPFFPFSFLFSFIFVLAWFVWVFIGLSNIY